MSEDRSPLHEPERDPYASPTSEIAKGLDEPVLERDYILTDPMEFRAHFSRKQLYESYALHYGLWRFLWLSITVLLALYPATRFLAAIYLAMWLLFKALRYRQVLKLEKAERSVFQPMRYRIAEEGIEISTKSSFTFFQWSSLSRVKMDPKKGLLYLYMVSNQFFPVRRSFAGEENWERLTELVRKHRPAGR